MTNTKIQTSIIIVTYNSELWITNCLESLFSQTYDYPFEILVIDNGSTDQTRLIIRRDFPDVILIESENKGFGAGNNLAAKSAQGDYLAFINPDTIADPHWLAELVKPLTQSGIVTTSKILLMDEPDLINTCGMTLHFTGFGFVNKYREPANAATQDFQVSGISGAAFALRHSDFTRLGGFDEAFFMYMEDVELSWRLAQNDFRILCTVKSQVQHSYSLRLPSHKIRALEKGRVLILRKYFSVSDCLILWPSLFLSFILSFARTAMQSLPSAILLCQSILEGYRVPLTPHSHEPLTMLPEFTDKINFSMITGNKAIRILGSLCNFVYCLNIKVALLLKYQHRPSNKERLYLEIES